MATWDLWFPDVLVHAPAAPDPLVRQALCRAAREFFRRTKAWTEWLDPEQTLAGQRQEYMFMVPAGSQIVRIERATVDGKPVGVRSFRQLQADWTKHDDGERAVISSNLVEFTLAGAFSDGEQIQVQVSLMPTPTATGIPDHLANRYLEPIASGALSILLATPDTPFFKPDLASVYAAMFERVINDAAADEYLGHTNNVPRKRPMWF